MPALNNKLGICCIIRQLHVKSIGLTNKSYIYYRNGDNEISIYTMTKHVCYKGGHGARVANWLAEGQF